MRLNGSIENREEFDNLMADSALAAIDQDAHLMQIETALRSLGARRLGSLAVSLGSFFGFFFVSH